MKFAQAFYAALFVCLLYTTITEGMSIASQLRCQCVKLSKPKKAIIGMKSFQFIPSGPYCEDTEVIITLQDGSKICVPPSTPWLEGIIKNRLERQKNEATNASTV